MLPLNSVLWGAGLSHEFFIFLNSMVLVLGHTFKFQELCQQHWKQTAGSYKDSSSGFMNQSSPKRNKRIKEQVSNI